MERIRGEVQRGASRGKLLGYPTINLPLNNPSISGIYSALVYFNNEMPLIAAVFADPEREVIEAHILDFKKEVYGETVTIELHERIRDSRKFGNDDELKIAIEEDILKVRKFFTK